VTRALCALVLAAGEGTRLRPLTDLVPKALCPVGNVVSLDRALARLARHGLSGREHVAVNASHLAEQVVTHVAGRAFVSVEPGPPALGTAGAVANLRDWIAGRDVLVGNADAYLAPADGVATDLAPLLHGWDHETVRVLCVPAGQGRAAEFGAMRFAGFSLLPASLAAALPVQRSELVREVWRPAEASGRLEVVVYDGVFVDTGTPRDYLEANLHCAGESGLVAADAVVTGQVDHAVIGAGAQVYGSVTRSVVWPGGYVGSGEHLVEAIRVDRHTTVAVGLSRTC
jgi:MurNAc alpha-1-phosphate uridylyltransferase